MLMEKWGRFGICRNVFAMVILVLAFFTGSCGGPRVLYKGNEGQKDVFNDFMVEGGIVKRIGPLRQGIYLDEAIALLGKPNQIKEFEYLTGKGTIINCCIYVYEKQGLSFYTFERSDKDAAPWVKQICTEDQRYKTAAGIHIGRSVFDFFRIYGERGIGGGGYETEEDNLIAHIYAGQPNYVGELCVLNHKRYPN